MDLRSLALSQLPEGASLKRDRGGAMYLTDAPRRGWNGVAVGFTVEMCGALAKLTPDGSTMQQCDFVPDRLAKELSGMKGASSEAIELFAECMKCVEAPDKNTLEKLDKNLRRAAALAMGAGGGEGLYYCALALAEAGRRLEIGG